MEFRILGPVEILDGERVVPLGGLKRRAVVAVLLLHPNRVVPSTQLIDLVWGDDPPAAALGSLQNHVLRLRRELGDRLVTRPRGYLLRVEPGELDVDRFCTLVEEARVSEPGEAAGLLNEATRAVSGRSARRPGRRTGGRRGGAPRRASPRGAREPHRRRSCPSSSPSWPTRSRGAMNATLPSGCSTKPQRPRVQTTSACTPGS